ncbi:MAG: hypothetical protein ACRD19_11530 [Terriglobia bacterium]
MTKISKRAAYELAWRRSQYLDGRIISFHNSRLHQHGYTVHSDNDEPLFSIPMLVLEDELNPGKGGDA